MPFCKYCFSSGMKRSIYTNHNTFITINNEKIIECKNLAKTKCSKCKHVGHTSKYCNQPQPTMTTTYIENQQHAPLKSIWFIQKYIFGIFTCIAFVYYMGTPHQIQ